MASEASFRDLQSIMRIAEQEAQQMEHILEPELDQVPEPVLEPVPDDVVSSINKQDITNAINQTNISSALNRIRNNPEELSSIMEQSMKYMTPETMEQARKLAMGGQGDQIRREMSRRGINPQTLRKQLESQKKSMKAARKDEPKLNTGLSCILITTSRQVKSRIIEPSTLRLSIRSILQTDSPVELSCSRLCKGPLIGKNIKVWYDSTNTGRNRRASKIIGFPVGGNMLVVAQDEHLSEKDFLEAEKTLV